MIKHTLEISREPAHLAVRLDQLVLLRDQQEIARFPSEDVGIVLVDHPQATYSHAALTALAARDATVVLCGRDHLPAALVLPLSTHSQVVERLNEQLAVRRPLRKKLWRQLVQAKIRAQAENLPADAPPRRKLLALAREVRSGDPTNVEAQAARVYWQHWLPDGPFRRDPLLPGINALLNYGYAVVRAAVARALVGAGLLPALGLHHRNRSNAFCLADDLVEPLRPLVDERVRGLYQQGCTDLAQPAKAELLKLLAQPVRVGREAGPLMVNLHRMAASLVQCYQGESQHLAIPRRITAKEVHEGDSR